MKEYTKPTVKIMIFRTDSNIATNSIYEGKDSDNVPVTFFELQTNGFNPS